MIQLLVDFQYLYYKYKFAMQYPNMKRHINSRRDYSVIHYAIDEIERIREEHEEDGHKVFVSICFDSNSIRTEDSEYKGNRERVLTEEDYGDIRLIEEILREAGYNTYRINGYEADDLIGNLVVKYGKNFDENVIYTPDADLLVYVRENVRVMRHKIGSGYAAVGMHNFERVVSKELKCKVPYNAIMVYKATVGDKSDNIKGIPGFGPKAFEKLVSHLNTQGVEWERAVDFRYSESLLELSRGYLGDEQVEQAKESLYMVRFMNTNGIAVPCKYSTPEDRRRVNEKYEIRSLRE